MKTRVTFGVFALAACLAGQLSAAIIESPFDSAYSVTNLGGVPNLPGNYGGLVFKAGDNNKILIGGAANGAGGVIHEIDVVRDITGHITGFGPTSTLYSTAPNIDGGLIYAPNGTLLYTGFSNNIIGQIKPGSSTPDKVVSAPGELSSLGTMQIVPTGYPGAGNFILASYSNSTFCNASLIEDGLGTYDVGACINTISGSGGPEGIIYVPLGSPLFTVATMLVSEYSSNRVSAFEVDGNGLPILATRQTFLSGLSGAEGATIDPVTGDFLFSTFGSGNEVYAVSGFLAPPSEVPEPTTLILSIGGIAGAALLRRRRTV